MPSPSMDLFVAADVQSLGYTLMSQLTELGYGARWIASPADVAAAIQAESGLVIVDVQWLVAGEWSPPVTPPTATLIFAGRGDLGLRQQAYTAGGQDYWTLPMAPAELRGILQRYHQQQRDRTELQRLRQQEECWRLLVKGTGDGIFDWDIPSGQVTMTARWMSMLGYGDGEQVGDFESWSQRLHPEDRDRALAHQAAYLQRQEPDYQQEYRLRCQDGSYTWILARAQAVWDEDDNPLRLVGWHQDIRDRKQLELALQASKAQLSDILNSIGASIGSFRYYDDGHWETVYHSLGCTAVFGFPLEDFSAEVWIARMVPEDAVTVIPALITAIRTQQAITLEYRYIHPDGNLRWISDNITSRHDPATGCWVVTMVGFDVGDRKRAEQARQDSEIRFRTVFEMAQIGIVVSHAPDYWLSFTNPFFQQLLGYRPDELATRRCADISYPDDLPLEHQLLDECAQGIRDAYQVEKRFICKNGQVIWTHVIVSMLRDGEGALQTAIVLVEDISNRKRAEMALQDSESRFRNLIEQTSDWVWQTNEVGQFTYVSPQVKDILGYDPNDILGQRPYTWMDPLECDRVQRLLVPYLHERRSFVGIEATLIHASGQPVILETSGAPILGQAGQLQGYRGIARDITERKQVEIKLYQAKREAESANQAKSQFLASMSHELRTPLNAILGFAQVMSYDTQLSAEHRNFIHTILRSGEHLLDLINEVLDLSKIEAGHMAVEYNPVQLSEFIQSSCEMLQQQAELKGLSLNVEIMPQTPAYVITDAHKLRQILINLIGNAIKFTAQGHVTLRVSSRIQAPGDRTPLTQVILIIEVEDTGVGIAPEYQDSIFDAFEQVANGNTLTQGTGLGLTISRRLVQLLGGQITLDSQPQQGSTFRVSIPVRLATAEDVLLTAPVDHVIGLAADQPVQRILVVDDHLDNCQFLVQTLQIIGFEVRSADCGETAIACWTTWQPQAIILDLNMSGLDGYATTRHIRAVEHQHQHTPPTRIIAMSASAFDRDRTDALSVGCDDFISKPIQLQSLFTKLANVLPVQYCYSRTVLQGQPPPTLRSDQLEVMPLAWVQALQERSRLCDTAQVDRLLTEIPDRHAELRASLQHYNDMSRLDLILDLAEAYLRTVSPRSAESRSDEAGRHQ
jgi:PAS domain S-box-containing protein